MCLATGKCHSEWHFLGGKESLIPLAYLFCKQEIEYKLNTCDWFTARLRLHSKTALF